ncbi:MAG: insulinase family protein [Chloroflexi bacterium]|nr:insulinase family protein [Chloroflexota bacterium]
MTGTHLSLPGPHSIVTATLANGLRLFIYENFASETVVIDGYLRAGSICEQAHEAGLASLSSGLLRRGTAKRSFDELNELADDAGISFAFGAGRHVLAFDGKALNEDIDLLLELLTESLTQPAFEPEQLEQVRARRLTSIQEREHSTRAMAALTFQEHIYADDHPYGRSLSGYADTIAGITIDAVKTFYQRFIGPDQGVLVLVGAINAGVAIEKLEQTVGQWQQEDARPLIESPPMPEIRERVEVSTEIPGKSQSDIVLGWPGIRRVHPDYFPMLLCNSILGSFGMGGRLGDHVREREGMAYYARSTFTANQGVGIWYAYAGVNPANVERTVETILSEIERIREEMVSDEELADVKANLSGSLPLRLETNGGIAGNLLNMAWYDLGLDYLMRYADRVEKIGKEDIQRLAQTYLDPDRYVLAIAGPPPSYKAD